MSVGPALRAYVPTAYYAPRCVVCDDSCRFAPTVKLPTPIKSPVTGRHRHCVHVYCLQEAWREGTPLPLPTSDELAAFQNDRGSLVWYPENVNAPAPKSEGASSTPTTARLSWASR